MKENHEASHILLESLIRYLGLRETELVKPPCEDNQPGCLVQGIQRWERRKEGGPALETAAPRSFKWTFTREGFDYLCVKWPLCLSNGKSGNTAEV